MSVAAVLLIAVVARAEPPDPAASPPSRPTRSDSPTAPAGAPNSQGAAGHGAAPVQGAAPAQDAITPQAEAAPGAPAPNGDALEAARRHFEMALECYSRGRYREAIDQLEQARRVDPAGKDLVYNLALVHEKLGELREALEYLRLYFEMETDAEERARTEASIARLEGALAEGYGSVPEAAPQAPVAATTPIALPPPGRLDAWVWGTGGVAVGALVVGAVFGLRALALNPGSDDATGGSRTVEDVRSDAEAAHRSAVRADVAFGLAAVSGVAATLLYFGRAPIEASPRQHAGVPMHVAGSSPELGLDLNFAF